MVVVFVVFVVAAGAFVSVVVPVVFMMGAILMIWLFDSRYMIALLGNITK